MIFSELVIGEVCEVGSSKRIYASEYKDSGIPFYRSKEVIQKARNESIKDELYIGDGRFLELDNKFGSPKYGDILLASIGANLGISYFVNTNYRFYFKDGNVTWFKNFSEKLNSKFLYYWFNSQDGQNKILNSAIGSAQKALTIDGLKKLKFVAPLCEEQKTIADTLTCLDDKIELNNRINNTLEEMAQAIFKSWFVDFEPFQDGEFEDSELGMIPKGWRVGTLGDIANIIMGQSPKGTSYNGNSDGAVFYQGRTDFGRRYPTIRLYTTEPKRMADKGDILLSVRAPVGDINVANEDCCIGRGLAALKSKGNCNSYLLYQSLNLKDSFNVYNGEGTVFGSINKDTLNNMRILIPFDKNILEFQDIVGKLDEIFNNNSIQIKILTLIRDSLLPKLMSGQIRVPIEEV